MKAIIDRTAGGGAGEPAPSCRLFQVGTMIELPRAALRAGEIADRRVLQFGTNDLTQTTFGLSRDDAGRSSAAYERQGIIVRTRSSPRPDGVGELVKIANRAWPQDPRRHQARHLRRAWRRSGLDPFLRPGRVRLRPDRQSSPRRVPIASAPFTDPRRPHGCKAKRRDAVGVSRVEIRREGGPALSKALPSAKS